MLAFGGSDQFLQEPWAETVGAAGADLKRKRKPKHLQQVLLRFRYQQWTDEKGTQVPNDLHHMKLDWTDCCCSCSLQCRVT